VSGNLALLIGVLTVAESLRVPVQLRRHDGRSSDRRLGAGSPSQWLGGMGPRLSLPWLPSCAFLLVAAYCGEFERLLAWPTRPFWGFGIAALGARGRAPQFVALVRPNLGIWSSVRQGMPYGTDHRERGPVLLPPRQPHAVDQTVNAGCRLTPGADSLRLLLACGCAGGLVW
jgi:hypothetical protein